MSSRGEGLIKIVVGIIIAAAILGGISLLFVGYWNPQTITITVKDKYVKNYTEESKYLIVDETNNTYEVTDLFWKWKFNSTDIYNSLDVGNTYEIETSGIRARLFSMYPNINKVRILEE